MVSNPILIRFFGLDCLLGSTHQRRYNKCMFGLLFTMWSCNQPESLKHTVLPVQDGSVVVLSASDLQDGLDHLLSVLTVIHPGELIEVEDRLTNQDTRCPEVFDGVANTNAWNQHCDNNQGTVFAGRSQSLFTSDVVIDEIFFSQFATYISSFIIESDDTMLMMNGYGDFYVQEDAIWMEMVGTYAYVGPDLLWSLGQQSTAIQVAVNASTMFIEGGISHTDDFPEGLSSIRLKEMVLDDNTASGLVIFQTTQGTDIEVELDGMLNDCMLVQDQELCYDWTSLKERTW